MSKKLKYIYPTLVLLALALAAFTLLKPQGQNIVYIDLPKVFENFQMKKDLESQLQSELKRKTQVLDSLKLVIGSMPLETEYDKKQVAYTRNDLMNTASSFDMEHQDHIKDYDNQVFNRLNQYLKDFAKEKGYDFILGAEGSGVIMAADDGRDVTEDVITYINLKYSGE